MRSVGPVAVENQHRPMQVRVRAVTDTEIRVAPFGSSRAQAVVLRAGDDYLDDAVGRIFFDRREASMAFSSGRGWREYTHIAP